MKENEAARGGETRQGRGTARKMSFAKRLTAVVLAVLLAFAGIGGAAARDEENPFADVALTEEELANIRKDAMKIADLIRAVEEVRKDSQFELAAGDTFDIQTTGEILAITYWPQGWNESATARDRLTRHRMGIVQRIAALTGEEQAGELNPEIYMKLRSEMFTKIYGNITGRVMSNGLIAWSLGFEFDEMLRIPAVAEACGCLMVTEGVCGCGAGWKLDGTTLTVSGDGCGVMEEFYRLFPAQREAVTHVVIEPGIVSVKNGGLPGLFQGFSRVTEIIFPEGIKEFDGAFISSCGALTKLVIPASALHLDLSVSDCAKLRAIEVAEGNPAFKTVDGSVYTKDGAALVIAAPGLSSVRVADGTKLIGRYAFSGHLELTFVTLPEGLQAIGQYAFSGCERLAQIAIPDSVTHIGSMAFNRCMSLSEVTIGANVTEIGAYAFLQCNSIRELVFRGKAPAFGSYAFSAEVLEKIVTPEGDETWNEDTLSLIKEGKETVGARTDGEDLAAVRKDIATIRKLIDAANECLTDAQKKGTPFVAGDTITMKTTYSGDLWVSVDACGGGKKNAGLLIDAVGLSKGPAGLASKFLWKVTDKLVTGTVTEDGFISWDLSSTLERRVANDALMKEFEEVLPMSGACGERAKWEFDGTTLVISGTGYFNPKVNIPSVVRKNAERVVLSEGLEGSMSKDLVFDGGKDAGKDWTAFCGFEKITEITLPHSMTSGRLLLMDCPVLRKITIAKETTRFEIAASGTPLSEIVVEEGNPSFRSIDGNLFTADGKCLLYCVPETTTYRVPDGVEQIGSYAFDDADKLTSITLPKSVNALLYMAFSGADALRTVRFEGSFPGYVEFAFYGETTKIYYPKKDKTWTKSALQSLRCENSNVTWNEPFDPFFWIIVGAAAAVIAASIAAAVVIVRKRRKTAVSDDENTCESGQDSV
ncbi:MAG: leucine-rich repeat protein [Lachnospiraceae bacterium]|nr:leucine-rich repeat protein [Lachnospiraceae bacterium]